jgi:hypothetical protein
LVGHLLLEELVDQMIINLTYLDGFAEFAKRKKIKIFY